MRGTFWKPSTTRAGIQAQVEQVVGPLQERRSQANRQQVGRPFELKRESDRWVRESTRRIVLRDWEPSLELESPSEVRASRSTR